MPTGATKMQSSFKKKSIVPFKLQDVGFTAFSAGMVNSRIRFRNSSKYETSKNKINSFNCNWVLKKYKLVHSVLDHVL